MTETKKPPPKDEYGAFKQLLKKVANVPKAEADAQEVEYQRKRALLKKRRA